MPFDFAQGKLKDGRRTGRGWQVVRWRGPMGMTAKRGERACAAVSGIMDDTVGRTAFVEHMDVLNKKGNPFPLFEQLFDDSGECNFKRFAIFENL